MDWAAFLRAREAGQGREVAAAALTSDAQAALRGESSARAKDAPHNTKTGLLAIQLPARDPQNAVALPLRLVSVFDPAPRTGPEWPAARIPLRDLLPTAEELARLSVEDVEDGDASRGNGVSNSLLHLERELANETPNATVLCVASSADWQEALPKCKFSAQKWCVLLAEKQIPAAPLAAVADHVLCAVLPSKPSDQSLTQWLDLATLATKKSSLLHLDPPAFARKLATLRLRDRPGGATMERAIAKTYHAARLRQGDIKACSG
ncbi:Hypothetical Protein FCC1311_063542 [Hondaea fermentalgiana]|uniref:Uncharacterized protein n=1 Tax=Hondaea fermentalgiana TaxID=2315210 RepID=A0A2R5GQI5_9STRA|nr:Hypothetical Protein FCC1311_063542 [Hondaea fermentalgiana]|eukprot:GBG30134.1 Hypothetical Protein FCC1311_063542 [Hondaea fermentalgiana]